MSDKSTDIVRMVRSKVIVSRRTDYSMDPAFWVSIPGKDMRFKYFSNGPDLLLNPPSLLFKGYTMDIFPGIKQNGREAHHSHL